MTDERYCQYVSTHGIALNCDVFPKRIIPSTNNINPNDYKGIKNLDKVYVVSTALHSFFKLTYPILIKKNIQIKLVTGKCDVGVPNELSKRDNIDYIKEFFTDNKIIIKWYTQNCDTKIEIPQLIPIPIGLDYHTLQEKSKHWWGDNKNALQQDEELQHIYNNALPHDKRLPKTFSYHHFQMFNRHDNDRHKANKVLKNNNNHVFLSERCNRNDIWNICTNFQYIISPHGNGLDCHRTYEVMALGSIPVVRTSSLDAIYKDMPVIILSSWDELTMELLHQKKQETLLKSRETLTLAYWIKQLNN